MGVLTSKAFVREADNLNDFRKLTRQMYGASLHNATQAAIYMPLVLTLASLATGLALVPLVVGGDVPGHEIEHPLAVVVVGGLVTSTLLHLFVLPSLYLRFAKSRKPARTPSSTGIPVAGTG